HFSSSKFEMRLVYRKKMLENRHFLIGIFQHFTTVAYTNNANNANQLLILIAIILLLLAILGYIIKLIHQGMLRKN
ncbi:hypothetical protein LOSG293_750010, partial [Secundilactobacillus oryzae JCM 18671]